MNRKEFLKKGLMLSGVPAILGLYAWQVEPFLLEFVHLNITIPHLPKTLKGKTIMQISDIHLGNRFPSNYLKESLQKAKKYNPDYLIYTGDYVSYESDEQLVQLRNMLPFFPRGRIGTVAILGNHDYGHQWSDRRVADAITEELTLKGIKVLRNEAVMIEGIHFIGLDDYWGPHFNPNTIMSVVKPGAAQIVLSHNPDTADLPIWNNFESWIFCGHTHGGQCKPPFLPPPLLPVKNKRYSSGEYTLAGNRKMYINRALGHLWQVRFNVRPEISIFTIS